MFTVKQSIFINASQQAVFDAIADPSRAAEWQAACQAADAGNAARLAQGVQVADTRNWLAQPMSSRYEVVEHEAPTKLRMRVVEGPVQFDFTWTLESVDGGTRLTGEGEGEWTGPHSQGMAARAADHNLAADLAVLRALIEQAA